MIVSTTLQADVVYYYEEVGNFFRILNASSPIDVNFFSLGSKLAPAESVAGGFAERFVNGLSFQKISIKSATEQVVQFVIRNNSEVSYDLPPFGNVNGSFAQNAPVVTDVSYELLAGNPYRRYLLIQNRDSLGSIYLNFGAADAEIATGVEVLAGGSYELSGFVPTNQVQVIGNIATNNNVVIIEG